MSESISLEGLSLNSVTEKEGEEEVHCTNQIKPVITPPTYLIRLMSEAARRLKLNQDDSIDLTTPTNNNFIDINPITLLSTSPETVSSNHSSTSTSTLTTSIITELSPKTFSFYSDSSNSSSRDSSILSSSISNPIVSSPPPPPPPPMTPFNLPLPSLNSANSTTSTITSTTTSNNNNNNLVKEVEKTLPNIITMTPTSYSNKRLEDVYTLPKEMIPEEDLLPPENFAMVASFVYRSSFPKRKNFPFLKSLGLKSVLTLILEDYPEQNLDFLESEGIKFFQFGIPGNKEPFIQIPDEKIVAALSIILDKRNHPILIHCNKGKHRTGCLIGCLRKVQQWSHTAIFDEYRRYSFPKSRSMDQQYIEAFNGLQELWQLIEPQYLPPWAQAGNLNSGM